MGSIAWGAKVSEVFLDRVKWIVEDLGIGDSIEDGMCKLMACMAWESGRTFSPSVSNMAGSGATGLIQFMPSTAKGLGTTTAALAKMTAENQLNYVWKYFAPYKGKLKTLGDLYMAILWPAGVGKSETYVLWNKAQKPTTYRQNAGLDSDGNGNITKAEATAKLTAMLVEGFKAGNVREYEVEDVAWIEAPAAPVAIPHVLPPMIKEVVQEVIEDEVPEVSKLEKVKKAASGQIGNLSGIGLIVGALMSNPDFTAKLASFTLGLSRGEGGWGAIMALVGAGLIAYKSTSTPKPPG